MDLVGRRIELWMLCSFCKFQSFWVNGFGWKNGRIKTVFGVDASFNPSESMDLVGRRCRYYLGPKTWLVSILLSQWIWLEGVDIKRHRRGVDGFNPSESMDLVGRKPRCVFVQLPHGFQSFWVNGFGWKDITKQLNTCLFSVSILLSQWIWLEAPPAPVTLSIGLCFNPSESMDLVGRIDLLSQKVLVF